MYEAAYTGVTFFKCMIETDQKSSIKYYMSSKLTNYKYLTAKQLLRLHCYNVIEGKIGTAFFK